MVRAACWIVVGAFVATGCSKDVTGRPYRPGLGTGASTGSVDTAGADELTTSISASAGADTGAASAGETDGGDPTASGGDPTAGPTTGDDGSTGSVDPTAGGSGGSGASTTTDSGGDDGGSTSGMQASELDPLLDIAEGGEVCDTPGHLGECSGVATVCRFHDSETGRCESCDDCGNLNAFCNDGTECDILFACFAGRCTNFCTLGTQGCGPPDACLDVGHPTRGVCDPNSI